MAIINQPFQGQLGEILKTELKKTILHLQFSLHLQKIVESFD